MRALVVEPQILFLDEPFSALDYEMTLFMRDQLQRVFVETGTTTVLGLFRSWVPDGITEAIAALEAGYAGGSARVMIDGAIPLWARVFVRAFCTLYFGVNLGAGAFLFTSRRNFDLIGGFDERYFAGEEVYFSLALKKLGRFKVLREPILTSGRKLRMYPAKQILLNLFAVIVRGPGVIRSRAKLEMWYDGKRESGAAM